MRKLIAILFSLLFCLPVLATDADGFASRAMYEKPVYLVLPSGKIEKATYWSLPLGRAEDIKVKRAYPGEGTLDVECTVNLALISSGYIDGSGYGDRGKITVKAHFMVEKEGKLTHIDLEDIDYVFYGGTRVKLKNSEKEQELYIVIEDETNKVQARGMKALIYNKVKPHNSLKHTKDIDAILGFAFTKEAAQRGYKADLAAE